MKLISDALVAEVYDNYPKVMRDKLLYLRQLIIDTASETNGVAQLEETLKWGEPSYLTKTGSTVRIAWSAAKPEQYGMYFNCKTSLIETFKTLYHDQFKFEGNRAIVFKPTDTIAIEQLKHCISLSLRYHAIKHLPMLGQ